MSDICTPVISKIVNAPLPARREIMLMLSWYDFADNIAKTVNKNYGTDLTTEDIQKFRGRAATQRLIKRIRATVAHDISKVAPIANKHYRLGALQAALQQAENTKDAVSVLRAVREEIEGKIPLVKIEDHQHFTQVINNKELKEMDTNKLINFLLGREDNGSTATQAPSEAPKEIQNDAP